MVIPGLQDYLGMWYESTVRLRGKAKRQRAKRERMQHRAQATHALFMNLRFRWLLVCENVGHRQLSTCWTGKHTCIFPDTVSALSPYCVAQVRAAFHEEGAVQRNNFSLLKVSVNPIASLQPAQG